MPSCKKCVSFPFEKAIHCCVVDGGGASCCSSPYRRTVVRRMWERSDLPPKHAKNDEESKEFVRVALCCAFRMLESCCMCR